MSNQLQLVTLFKALADPTRLSMIGHMVDRAVCGQELAERLGVSAPTVSHHLRVLRSAGLLVETREHPYTFYQLDHSALEKAVRSVADKKRVQKLADEGGMSAERRKVLRSFFDGKRLVSIPSQRKKKEIVFEEILRRLPRRKEYGERELSLFIETIHSDFCTIRREFIMGKYMTRKNGRYRLAERGRAVLEGS